MSCIGEAQSFDYRGEESTLHIWPSVFPTLQFRPPRRLLRLRSESRLAFELLKEDAKAVVDLSAIVNCALLIGPPDVARLR
jgi:hypothetical protein